MNPNVTTVSYHPSDNPYETRFLIVDKESGEALDDAQGCGYRTAQKAYAAYSWKTRDRSKYKEKREKEQAIRAWMKQNKIFVRTLDQMAFDIISGGDPNEKITAKTVRELLKEMNIETEFEPKDILKVWKKR